MQQAETIQTGKALGSENIQRGASARTKVRTEILDESGVNAGLKASTTRRRRDSGAMLLAILFMMAIMVIVAMAMAPSFIQQAKRDREAEMIHRGTEYARAIKKYYKKFGRYPANLEQLENTNNLRFLRKRFKDPLTKGGDWKLLHYGDIQAMGVGAALGALGAGMPGGQGGLQGANQLAALTAAVNAGATGSAQGANTAPQGAQLTPQQPGAGFGNQSPGNNQADGGTSPGGGGGGVAAGGAAGQSGFSLTPGVGQNSGAGGAQGQNPPGQNAPGQTGSNNTIFGNSGVGGQTFGGGAIVGVASKDKEKTIRIYNKKKTYDEWVFIYSPVMETGSNTLLRGPFNGQTYGAAQIGTPAGQLNQGNQSPFGGQQPGGQAQQPGGFGQQNPQQNVQPNQQLTPGGQFPPDQTQPQ
jgi:type II secretory pathway pseudopilin PulG